MQPNKVTAIKRYVGPTECVLFIFATITASLQQMAVKEENESFTRNNFKVTHLEKFHLKDIL